MRSILGWANYLDMRNPIMQFHLSQCPGDNLRLLGLCTNPASAQTLAAEYILYV
jgi:hypothetical protein